MDEQEELRSSYMKNLRFIDGKIYLNARFIDEMVPIGAEKESITRKSTTNLSQVFTPN